MMTLPEEAIEAANAISASLDAAVFVYSGSIDSEGFGHLIGALQPSDEQPRLRNAILFLTTYGGSAGAAYRIARILQTITENFYLCVPSVCKSAGTLIALGATEIYMPIASELGPLDVQLWRRDEIGQRRSGMVVRTALDGLATETFKVFRQAMIRITVMSRYTVGFEAASRVASMIATGVMAPVYQQVDPESLGNDLRDLSIATEYGERLVGHGGNATKETVRKLVEDYPSHDFIIDREEAQEQFAKVNETTTEMDALIRVPSMRLPTRCKTPTSLSEPTNARPQRRKSMMTPQALKQTAQTPPKETVQTLPTWIKDAKQRGAAIVKDSARQRAQMSLSKETATRNKNDPCA